MSAAPGEIWEAIGLNVYRGKDCIGIFDTDNATIEIMEARARIAAAAPILLISLQQLEKYMTDCGYFGGKDAQIEMAKKARAAIRAATGAA